MSRVWLITGCSSGFGQAQALHALEQGDRVVATARQVSTLDPIVEHAARLGSECLALELDVTDATQCQAVMDQSLAQFGTIDVLYSNAGCGVMGSLEETPAAMVDQVFQTNVLGPMNLCRAVLPIMRQQRSGRILLMSAIVGFANHAAFSVYGASKFALQGFGEGLAEDVAPLGIQVTMILPGPFRSEFLNKSMTRVPSTIPDYAASAGKYIQMIERINGRQPGNLSKAASAIATIVDAEQAPRRLFLGKYACDTAKKRLQQLTEELNTWQELGLATDGDHAV